MTRSEAVNAFWSQPMAAIAAQSAAMLEAMRHPDPDEAWQLGHGHFHMYGSPDYSGEYVLTDESRAAYYDGRQCALESMAA